jgi:hypothetical protein
MTSIRRGKVLARFIMLAAVHLSPVASHAQIQVVFHPPPPFQFKLEHMWKVTLINPTATTYRVYLRGTATESNAGLILEAIAVTFTLPQGTRVITPRDISPIDVYEANRKYSDVVNNVGGLPDGNYEVCVSVINADNGMVLGRQCIQQQVMNVTQVELLSPENHVVFQHSQEVWNRPTDKSRSPENSGSTETSSLTQIAPSQYIVFSWLPPTPVSAAQLVTYTLRIVEIIGRQSPYDAMHSNPAFYQQSNIYSTMFQFPVAARRFEHGKAYAWQVNAYINGTSISQSEVWEFAFAKDEEAQSRAYVGAHEHEISPLSQLPHQNATAQGFMLASSQVSGLDQTEGSPLVFSGTSTLESQSANRKGTNSEVPERYGNWGLNPTAALYGVPFASSITLSSQNDPSRQNINSFALNFDRQTLESNLTQRLSAKVDELNVFQGKDLSELKAELTNKGALKSRLTDLARSPNANNSAEIDSLKKKLEEFELLESKIDQLERLGDIRNADDLEKLKDPNNLQANLDRLGLRSGAEKIFMAVQVLGIGTNYPSYTPYTLDGVPVTGVNIEMTPAFFYLAFTGTLNQQGITNSAYRRNLYAGRFGFGGREGSHLHFTGLYARDDESSISVDSSNLTLTPNANHLFGVDAKLLLFDDRLTLAGEAVGSVLTRDVRDAGLETESVPQFVKDIVHPKVSSSFGYMYAVKTSYTNDETSTRLSFGLKMIRPGFASLGVPSLRTDNFGFEARFDQRFVERRISLSTFFKREHDNLIDWKSSTTTTTALGVNLGLGFRDLPSLTLTYSPYFQRNDVSDPLGRIDNATSMFSLASSYRYPVADLQSSTSFSFSLQQTKTYTGTADFSTNSYTITEGVSFKIPLTIAGSFGIINSKPPGTSSKITTFDLSGSYLLFDVWENSVGFNSAVEQNMNNRNGFYLSSSLALWGAVRLEVRAEQTTYTELGDSINNYNESILKATLDVTW